MNDSLSVENVRGNYSTPAPIASEGTKSLSKFPISFPLWIFIPPSEPLRLCARTDRRSKTKTKTAISTANHAKATNKILAKYGRDGTRPSRNPPKWPVFIPLEERPRRRPDSFCILLLFIRIRSQKKRRRIQMGIHRRSLTEPHCTVQHRGKKLLLRNLLCRLLSRSRLRDLLDRLLSRSRFRDLLSDLLSNLLHCHCVFPPLPT